MIRSYQTHRSWLPLSVLLIGVLVGGWIVSACAKAQAVPLTSSSAGVETQVQNGPAVPISSPRVPTLSEFALSATNISQVIEVSRLGEGQVAGVDYDPTGQRVALASSLGVLIYEAGSLAQLSFIATTSGVENVSFAPDGLSLAWILADGTVQIGDVASGEIVASIRAEGFGQVSEDATAEDLENETDLIHDLAYAPDGSTLALASSTEIKIWPIGQDGLLDVPTNRPGAIINGITFTPDGSLLASAALTYDTIQIWDVDTGQAVVEISGSLVTAQGTVFSPDGALVASGTAKGSIQLGQLSTGEILGTIEAHRKPVIALAFSADGKTLASGSYDGAVKLWAMPEGIPLQTVAEDTGYIQRLAFSRDGTMLSGISDKGLLSIWPLAGGGPVQTLGENTMGEIETLAFSPDSLMLSSGTTEGLVTLWDIPQAAPLGTVVDYDAGAGVSSLSFSPDGSLLVTGTKKWLPFSVAWDDTVQIRRLADEAVVHTLTGPREKVASCEVFQGGVTFSPDGEILAVVSYDHAVRLWRVSDGTLLHSIRHHTEAILDQAFSPDGSIFATASEDGAVNLWSQPDQTLLYTLTQHLGGATGVAFSPDGALLVTGAGNGILRLWDAATGDPIFTFEGQKNRDSNLAFSLDGSLLVAGADDHTVQVWAVEDGALLNSLTGHTDQVKKVAFSPDGALLASGAVDGTVRLWGLNRVVP
jgi:WD40 repeat protein